MATGVDRIRQKVSVGEKYGELLALEVAGEYRGENIWLCRCICGNMCKVLENRLKNGEVCDCGCSKRTRKRQDLSGQRFGRLTAVRYEFDDSRHRDCWTFRCDCGMEKILPTDQVKWNGVRSCGCLRRERTGNMNKKDLADMRFGRLQVVRRTEMRDTPGTIVWECRCDCGNTIYCSVNSLTTGKVRSCGCLYRDTRGEGAKNRDDLVDDTNLTGLISAKKLRTDNTSGATGVYLNKKTMRWTAYLNYRKKRYYLGLFDKKEDAIKARKRAEQELHDPMIEKHWDEMTKTRQDEYLAYLKGIPVEYPPSVNI